MKQLYHTSCKPEVGMENIKGQQFRAASNGLGLEQLRPFRRIPDYELPARMPDQTPPEQAPIRLALLPSPVGDGKRVLAHVTYVGLDPASRRFGNSFAHLLIDLPPTCTVRQAIQTWGSAWWKKDDPGGGTLLDDVEALPTGTLDDQRLITYARSERGAHYLEFLAHAALDHAAGQRLFLVSEPEEAALLIYGLTRMVPEGLLKNFSFSTYERYPESAQTLLTATCWPDLAAQDLPPRCYEGMGLALHTVTGKQSPLPPHHVFIAGELAALKAGNIGQLDRFQELCANLRVDSLEMVGLIFDLFFTEPRRVLNANDFAHFAKNPPLLLSLCQDPDFERRLLTLAEEQPGFLPTTFSQVVNICRQKPAVLAQLFGQARDQSHFAFQQNNIDRGYLLLTQILPVIDPAEAASAQKNLLNQMAQRCLPNQPTEALALGTRVALVQMTISQARLEKLPNAHLSGWIIFSPEESNRWLQRDLARPIRLYAAKEILHRQALPISALLSALADDPTFILNIYLDLLNDQAEQVAERWLSGAVTTPESLLAILQKLSKSEHPGRFTRVAWPAIDRVLARLPEHGLRSEKSLALVTWLLNHDRLLSPGQVDLARAWDNLARFIAKPYLVQENFEIISLALSVVRKQVGSVPVPLKTAFSLALGGVVKTFAETELILLYWGNVLAGSIPACYTEFLLESTRWSGKMADTHLAYYLIYIGLGGADQALAKALQPEQLIPILRQAVHQMDGRLYKRIAHDVKDWPPKIQQQWANLHIERPKGLVQKLLGG